ncbi:hypothetical protein SVAN01_05661 [Stagonosporopsis vannaccii]|nr:hypothetical protein SVAN01_05661 [Stagonosporopsis vannaccii]
MTPTRSGNCTWQLTASGATTRKMPGTAPQTPCLQPVETPRSCPAVGVLSAHRMIRSRPSFKKNCTSLLPSTALMDAYQPLPTVGQARDTVLAGCSGGQKLLRVPRVIGGSRRMGARTYQVDVL